ncbi:MAG: hypothetical protein IJD16_05120 [Desulfovibrio sp.]|nr:hypothetical protein [Desulfovibrio sp.]
MSFIGAVSSSVRKVLAEYARDVTLPPLIVGAGNFTVPSVLRSGGYAGPITACDVSLYTSALGAYLAGWDLEMRERDDCPALLKGLIRTDTPLMKAASVSLLLDLREVWQGKNAFQCRLVGQYRRSWDLLLAKTCEGLERYRQHIGSIDYQARDGFDLLEHSDPASHTVFAFPPTYKAGYEKLEALLRAAIDWTPPPYREMTDKSLELYEQIARFASYYVVLEKDLPEVYAILGKPSAILPRGRGRTTCIVARHAPTVVVRACPKTMPVGPIWAANTPVTGKELPGFAPIKRAQSLRLNQLYLARRIDYYDGGVDACIVLTLDGKIVGKADFFKQPGTQWKLPDNPDGQDSIYIMCDLAVASSCEKRLAKLVLLLLSSTEVRDWLNAKLNLRLGWAVTTAFSKGPVSMKYRGIFQLYSRKQDKKTGQFSLNYYVKFENSMKENFDLWLKKYNKREK